MAAGRCRSCGATIEWGLTPKGRRMPLDPLPVSDGNVIATGKVPYEGQVMLAVTVLRSGEDVPTDSVRFRSHFESCPKANLHRRRGAKR